MIYFDNSATTRFKPDCVLSSVLSAVKDFSANPGRSSHGASTDCAQKVWEARLKLASFVCADEVIFTDNCTGALNLAILGTVKPCSHVVVSALEHNSVLRTVHALSLKGVISYSVATPENGVITARSVYKKLKSNTLLVVCSHVSNVTGAISEVESIGRVCAKRGITFLVDGAQSVGYLPVDMDKINASMLAVAPHKGLHAIQGVGALCLKKGVPLTPYRYGGTGTSSLDLVQPTDIPDGFETGTLPVPAILSIPPAIDFVSENFSRFARHIKTLSDAIKEELKKEQSVTLYSSFPSLDGIIAFNIGNLDSNFVASTLYEKFSVCVRGGYHCAPLTHKELGTKERGAVRISLGCDNTEQEVADFLLAVKEIASSLR